MKKQAILMVLLAMIMCTNLISCKSSSNREPNAFDLNHAKKVNVSQSDFDSDAGREAAEMFNKSESPYHNGLKSFEKNGLYGYVDQNNNVVIAPQYKYAQEFYNENRAIVSPDGNKYGVINKTGAYVITPQFDNDITSLSLKDGLYRVLKNGKVGIVDTMGGFVVEFGKYDDIDRNGYYGFVKVMKNNKWGFVDTKGKEIVNPQYDEIELPLDADGFAAVKKDNNWGLLDLSGKVIIPIEHKQTHPTGGNDRPALIFPYDGKYDREIIWFEIYKDGSVIAKTRPEQ